MVFDVVLVSDLAYTTSRRRVLWGAWLSMGDPLERCNSWGELTTCRRVDKPELGFCGSEIAFPYGLEATPSPPWPWISDRHFFSLGRKKQRKMKRRCVANLRLERFVGTPTERDIWKVRRFLKKFRHPVTHIRTGAGVDSRFNAYALQYVWMLWANFPVDATARWDQWLKAARGGGCRCLSWGTLHPPIPASPVPPLEKVDRSR